MSYSIKIGKHSIELAGYAGKVVAPNTQMTGLDQLSEHVSAMLKGSQRQTHSEEKQAA
ncbi:hypothetical protein [Citrobacter amalonaticus]|uniref:hypothetical protein n=1 Tax=Citrobacter amalonaticus TaxID=35703 RepID=UPI001905A628|nr:hypothetical protein [Citrobacter amalonaticus]MBJ9081099.1 hypothetical protein [Citrobacter amalonaticus]MBW0871103.1 hypothetical protein [Citrobacter amalonaticus]